MLHKYIRLIVLVISVLTIVSGLIQLFSPAFILSFIHGDITPSTEHDFAIIGMFMFLFGGLMLHSLYNAVTDSVVVFWCALQKFGASIAVFLAIAKNLFAPVAALVAGFDLFSSFIFFITIC
jgi:hypothetical protein